MGAGIAYVSAMAGIEVVLKDVTLEAAEKGKDYSRALLKKAMDRGKMDGLKAEGILALIKPSADAADLKGSDLIIEAVFENRELKATVTKEAEPMLAENTTDGRPVFLLQILLRCPLQVWLSICQSCKFCRYSFLFTR